MLTRDRRINYFCSSILLLLAASGVYATVAPQVSNILQEALNNARESKNVAGATAAVILPGHGLWIGASGLSDETAGTPIAPEDLFYIASLSKTFVSATVLQLAEEGVLTLEDSLEKWFPGLVPNSEDITIRHLLNHTSGIPDFLNILLSRWRQEPGKVWKPEEVAGLVINDRLKRLNSTPGTKWNYSGTGYIVLGDIVEKATGSTLAQEMLRRFFEPLNLNNTFLDDYGNIEGELAYGHDSGYPLLMLHHEAMYAGLWGAGGMISNAGDLARWAESLYGGPVLNQNSLNEMYKLFGKYGLGVERISTSIGLGYGHSGGVPGFRSCMCYFPDKEVTIVVLHNDSRRSSATTTIFNALASKIPAALEIPVPDPPPLATTSISPASKMATTWADLRR